MKGYPKQLKSKADYFNCLAMVQAGELEAAGLTEALDALEKSRYITTGILETPAANQVLIMFCNEAAAGAGFISGDLRGTVKEVAHNTTEDINGPDTTLLTLDTEITAGANEISVFNGASDVLARVGITEEEIKAIREVLKNYE